MADSYETVSVHGTLPLVIDDRGALRFARLGEDSPSDCLQSPDQLPEAQIDLFVLKDSGTLHAWVSAIQEVSNNAVEVIVPEVRWPRFALLVRHDRPSRTGTTFEDVVALRSVNKTDPDPADVRRMGAETRKREIDEWNRLLASREFAREWAAEISILQGSPEAEVDHQHSLKYGRLAFTLTKDGEIRGLGPIFCLRRDGGAYVVSWQVEQAGFVRDGASRIEAAAAEHGLQRDGLELSMRIESLDPSATKALSDVSSQIAADMIAPRIRTGM